MSRQSCFGWLLAGTVTLCLGAAAPVVAQEPPKPGPEFDVFKKMVGDWDCTIRFGGDESKGSASYKMECGGLWLVSNFKGTFAGQPFQGRGADSYDAKKKKYVSVWVDSMTTTPMISEGTYDEATKALTMTTEMPGPDGKVAKHKMVSKFTDDNTIDWSMALVGADGKDTPVFSINYKRKAK